MVFGYIEYIIIFLPIVLVIYLFLIRKNFSLAGRTWLLLSSLAFYGFWRPIYLPLLMLSITANYLFGKALLARSPQIKRIPKTAVLVTGICFNVALLGYFKYADFFLQNVNFLFNADANFLKIALPLGISYFTFVQISFLVDCFRGTVQELHFINYSLFVSFFPKLLQGPITYHEEIAPQFMNGDKRTSYENIAKGLFIFSVGLFKKMVIADSLGIWVEQGFDTAPALNFFEAWFTSLSYTFQLYFDFSGYTDMAIGAALMFNIRLPLNFNTPYRSLSIQEFWQRWHISLSAWLRDYLYKPIVFNRRYWGKGGIIFSLMVTFTICGLWHGANWNYVLFGAMHGAGLCLDFLTQRARSRIAEKLPSLVFGNAARGAALAVHRIWAGAAKAFYIFLCWFVTFNFINASFVLFRAVSIDKALKVYAGMLGLNGVILSEKLKSIAFLNPPVIEFGAWLANLGDKHYYLIYMILAAAVISMFGKNSMELADRFKPNIKWALAASLLLGIGIMHVTQISEFIYAAF